MNKKPLELVAEISPRTSPKDFQTLPLHTEEAHPDQYLLNVEGKLQTLEELRTRYNIIIRKA